MPPADAARIIVTEVECDACGMDRIEVFHDTFSELRTTGPSASEAAERLAQQLAQNLATVVDPAHDEPLRQALADVRAFLNQAAPRTAST